MRTQAHPLYGQTLQVDVYNLCMCLQKLIKRSPLDIITHENRCFSLDLFDVAFEGEFEELEQGDIEETNQGEDQMKANLQASLSEIWDLVDPE